MAGDNRVPSTKCVANFIGSPSTRTPPTAATRFDLMHSAYIADTLRIKAGLGDPLLKDVLHKNTIYRLNSSRRQMRLHTEDGCQRTRRTETPLACTSKVLTKRTTRCNKQTGITGRRVAAIPAPQNRNNVLVHVHHPREDEVEGERREISLF